MGERALPFSASFRKARVRVLWGYNLQLCHRFELFYLAQSAYTSISEDSFFLFMLFLNPFLPARKEMNFYIIDNLHFTFRYLCFFSSRKKL